MFAKSRYGRFPDPPVMTFEANARRDELHLDSNFTTTQRQGLTLASAPSAAQKRTTPSSSMSPTPIRTGLLSQPISQPGQQSVRKGCCPRN